ncbi:MAG: deoxyguanosinetriphosphate triphosphohydrolase [Proteobacteria bacterium]|nr:deoxyguanosinetriphosphate triphosphohydrolase [Pseudomonadota bacterium]
MITREEYEQREDRDLAGYAMRSMASRGRRHVEQESEYRTCFARDRDRIVHCEAFRRLEYKTQVFVNHEGDYYRTRLTHTLEVAQISRGIARTLRLNEDLAEAIALAHDLGHTPFGHRGETALNELMAAHGGFEHNRQSYRVVTLLERRYPDFPGLNLSSEVLEGLLKHASEYDSPELKGLITESPGSPTLEAQVVNVADEIAYMNHDLDDGLESGMLRMEDLERVRLWRETASRVESDHPGILPKILKSQTIRRLIHLLVMDIQGETHARLARLAIKKIEDVRATAEPLVSFSEGMRAATRELKDFLFANLYRHYRVERMADKSNRILAALFNTYLNNPKVLPPSLERIIREEGGAERRVCDYIAGMTDRFALSEYAKLFDPDEKV